MRLAQVAEHLGQLDRHMDRKHVPGLCPIWNDCRDEASFGLHHQSAAWSSPVWHADLHRFEDHAADYTAFRRRRVGFWLHISSVHAGSVHERSSEQRHHHHHHHQQQQPRHQLPNPPHASAVLRCSFTTSTHNPALAAVGFSFVYICGPILAVFRAPAAPTIAAPSL